MKKIYILLLSCISLLLVDDVKAQLKLGDQPTSVQKSVILDLQGSNGRQGVWLPRISDTTNATGIDALNPPDGVMIYHTPSSQVMIRKNGFWSSLLTSQTYITGTSGTDFTINSSGSTHIFNLPTASAVNRGLLSSADWTTFNSKGTVSSVGAGYGINGGTITTTGTHSVDTLSVSTKAWRQKGIDSVASLLNAYIPATRTLNGLALSSDQTFTLGTTGNDLSISSAGTTHTFNVPSASPTARGVVTTGAQTLAGLKTFSTGATVSGATGNVSNLTLGITSATTPGTSTDRYLTVDALGKVTLNSVNVITNSTLKIKTYTLYMNNLPANLPSGSTLRYTITIPGGGLSTTSTVNLSPVDALNNTTTINWARVANANTIEVSITANGNNQAFTNGTNATFNISVIEF